MDKNNFYKCIQELQNMYKKELNTTELEIWYENLKNINLERFKMILAEVYKTNKFMPTLATLFEINKSIPYEKKEEKKMYGDCKKCNNTGYVVYKKKVEYNNKDTYTEFVAICDCGRQRKYDGRNIKEDRDKTNYYTPLNIELGL